MLAKSLAGKLSLAARSAARVAGGGRAGSPMPMRASVARATHSSTSTSTSAAATTTAATTTAATTPASDDHGKRPLTVVPRSFTMIPHAAGAGGAAEEAKDRHYAWIAPEAEVLIARAYAIHMQNQEQKPFPPSLGITNEQLETLAAKVPHYKPKTMGDHVALRTTQVLEKLMFLFFREKYVHHALTLETVASVPGFVAAMHRHLRSLRRMQRDYGWTEPLLEESINERAHLLIWLDVAKPTAIERAFVMVAQAAYTTFYASVYAVSPRTAHRAVGYLEEAALRAYTDFLESIDKGEIPNKPVPPQSLAARFYRLAPGSTLRDVVLRVRGDEAFHALYNHGLADLASQPGGLDKPPVPPKLE